MTFEIIVAMDLENGIGKGGELPWHIKADLKHFKEVTTQTSSMAKKNVVIMGRKTWESLPEEYKPLPGRFNVVLTKQTELKFPEYVFVSNDIEHALKWAQKKQEFGFVENIFVIGGGEVFNEALCHPSCRKIHATHVLRSFACDTFFPPFMDKFERESSSPTVQEGPFPFYFAEYHHKS